MSKIQEIIMCPVCHRKMGTDSPPCAACENFSRQAIEKMSKGAENFLALRPNYQSNNLKPEYKTQKTFTTQLFANSLFPWFYEKILPVFWAIGLRGWGGIEREYEEVIKFLGQDPKIVMDLSCGTGIMARRLAKSQFYPLIIALDYSESMLKMLINQVNSEKTTKNKNLVIIRGDALSIPLISNSVDAIYVGAAIHCWSEPQKGIKEIYRVLRPGGKVFGTTFTKFLPKQEFYCFSIEELHSLFQEAKFSQELLEIKSQGIYVTIKGFK